MAGGGMTVSPVAVTLLVCLLGVCVGLAYGRIASPLSLNSQTDSSSLNPSSVGGGSEVRRGGERRVPIYVRKARLRMARRRAYLHTLQARMATLARASTAFATRLYLQHAAGSHGNVLLSPLVSYASLAMVLTAARGRTKREVLAALNLQGQGRGVHASLQRTLTSLADDDTDDVNDNIYARDLMDVEEEDEGGQGDGVWEPSQKELEDIVRNDHIIDNTISYGTGQSQIRYSTNVRTAAGSADRPGPKTTADPPSLTVRLANGMFHSEEVALSQHFSNRLVSLYGAPPLAMQPHEPFTSVNLWVDAATRGAVPDILTPDSVGPDTLLAVASALAFRGAWRHNFDDRETELLDFKPGDGGESVFAPFLYRTGNYSVKVLQQVGAKVAELPYGNPRYSLYVFLPRPSATLADVERGLRTQDLRALLHDMPQPAVTILMLPKFRLASRLSLTSQLKAMGIRRLFAKGKADLRRMTDDEVRSLFVNDFFHYATLDVNEGTPEALRDTGVVELGSPGEKDFIESVATVNDTEKYTNSSSAEAQKSHHDFGEVMLADEDAISLHDVIPDGVTDKTAEPGDDVKDDDGVDSQKDNDVNNGDGDGVGVNKNGGDIKVDAADGEVDSDYDYDYDHEEGGGGGEDTWDSNEYFIADRPFFFVVKDKTNDLILLMGRVVNPAP